MMNTPRFVVGISPDQLFTTTAGPFPRASGKAGWSDCDHVIEDGVLQDNGPHIARVMSDVTSREYELADAEIEALRAQITLCELRKTVILALAAVTGVKVPANLVEGTPRPVAGRSTTRDILDAMGVTDIQAAEQSLEAFLVRHDLDPLEAQSRVSRFASIFSWLCTLRPSDSDEVREKLARIGVEAV